MELKLHWEIKRNTEFFFTKFCKHKKIQQPKALQSLVKANHFETKKKNKNKKEKIESLEICFELLELLVNFDLVMNTASE